MATTRWQGIAAKAFAPQPRATARTDFGEPMRLAMPVSLTVAPTGIFRAADRSGGAATALWVRHESRGQGVAGGGV
jgi:hypothetical protein